MARKCPPPRLTLGPLQTDYDKKTALFEIESKINHALDCIDQIISPPTEPGGESQVGCRIVRTATYTTPLIGNGVVNKGTILMSAVGEIYALKVDRPARVRFYSLQEAQDRDMGREVTIPLTDPIPADGVQAEFVMTSRNLFQIKSTSPVPGFFNGDTPGDPNHYISVTNLQCGATVINVEVTYAC